METNKPRLENWTLAYGSLVGDIYDDNRFPDGYRVITSEVKQIDLEAKTARTRNTDYILGQPLNGTVQGNAEAN